MTQTRTAARWRHPGFVATCGVMALLVVAFVVTTLPGVRDSTDFRVGYDGWLRGAAYAACGLVALLASLRSEQRGLWVLLAVAVWLRALGFVIFIGSARAVEVVPLPSLVDAVWLAIYLTVLAFVGTQVHARIAHLSTMLLLDALAGVMLTLGAALAFVYGRVLDLDADGGRSSVIVTNLTFPLSDAAILVLVVGLVVSHEWRPRLPDVAVLVALAGFVVGDIAFLSRLGQGTYRPDSWVAALSLVMTAVMAAACFHLSDDPVPTTEKQHQPGFLLPVGLGVVAVGLIAYASTAQLPSGAVFLVAGSLLVMIYRAVATLSGDRAIADAELRAKNDALLRFQALVEASDDFIAMAGMDGDVIYVNPAGRELVGVDPDRDVTTTTIMDYLTEEGQRASVEVEQPAVLAEGRWTGESTLRDRRGGPPIPVAISSFLMYHPATGQPFALATVQRDITERLAAQRALEDLAGQRQTLLARLVQAQEDERTEIAADVHDDSVQALAAVDLRLGLLRRQLGEVAPELIPNADKALETVQEATSRLRHLLFDLESPALHDDLATALTVAADYVFEGTEVAWRLSGDRDVDLPTPSRVTAYRVVKEALSNVRRHAGATRVEIGLARGDDGVSVTVTDDGVGMDPGEDRHRAGHRGLSSSRDRATVAGGWLRVDGSPGEGTRVVLWLPVVAPSAHDVLDA